MSHRIILPILAAMGLLASCDTAKHGIADGRYRLGGQVVNVEVVEDTILAGPTSGFAEQAPLLVLPPIGAMQTDPVVLVQHSFDIDLLTIPLKYRPAAGPLQPQLETQISAAVYAGRRTDRYTYRYEGDRPARRERKEHHMGTSFGLVAGLGGASVTSANTGGRTPVDYVGVTGSLGIALIGAVNKFSLGIAVGQDHLLSSDARHWVFERQPWLGFAFGLNLN